MGTTRVLRLLVVSTSSMRRRRMLSSRSVVISISLPRLNGVRSRYSWPTDARGLEVCHEVLHIGRADLRQRAIVEAVEERPDRPVVVGGQGQPLRDDVPGAIDLGERAKRELDRPRGGRAPRGEGARPHYLWIDATYLKVRRGGRIVSVAVIIAVGVNADGRREVLRLEVGTSEAEPIWTDFLRTLPRALHAQRPGARGQERPACRVGLHRDRLRPGHVGGGPRQVVGRRRSGPPRVPKLAALLDAAAADVLAYMTFPKEHRAKLHSTNPIERLNGEIKRRTEVVGVFPSDAAIVRLVGALLLEQNDEWAVPRSRCMTLESVGRVSDDPLVNPPAVAR